MVPGREVELNEFTGRTAVVTGAASGIGRAIAERCAREGMKLVLADIEQDPLAAVVDSLQALGTEVEVTSLPTDVSSFEQVEELARVAFDTYGEVHLLFNNAGVSASGPVWESSLDDWQWVLGVNLCGVVHGVKAFVPRMLPQQCPSHIVNTSSILGLVASPDMGVYNVAKAGIIALTETLYLDLAAKNSSINVSVLCPAWVNTRILESYRNRPAGMKPEAEQPHQSATSIEHRQKGLEAGLSPDVVAISVFQAIRDNRFYIFTHPETPLLLKAQLGAILAGEGPVNPVALAAKLAAAQSQKPEQDKT